MVTLRSFTFMLLWALWTGLFAFAIPALSLGHAKPATIRRFTRLWAHGFLRLSSTILGIRYKLTGFERQPVGPCLIVANHQSTWETIAALVLFPDVAIVAKQELLRIPVMGWFLKKSPMIIIDRSDGVTALRSMVALSRTAVLEGRSILIFPQGTRTAVGTPVKFRRGVELLYRALGLPVLPVSLNSGYFWKLGGQSKVPGTIIVAILPVIAPGMSAQAFIARAEAMLASDGPDRTTHYSRGEVPGAAASS
jgi:1-acyl-sn-glycerol-3-phosphate acyltransferase